MDLPPLFEKQPSPPELPQTVELEVLSTEDLVRLPEEEQPQSTTPPAQPHPLLGSIQDLLKNPLVLAGGALVAGIAISRLTGNKAVRDRGTAWLVDLLKDKLVKPQTGPAASTAPPPPAAAPGAGHPLLSGELPGILLEKVMPALGDSLKKRLAELLRK